MLVSKLKYSLPSHVEAARRSNCFTNSNHPLTIVKDLIVSSLSSINAVFGHNSINDEVHTVTVKDNFDRLLFDIKHPARRSSDTYYISEEELLRTHMTSRDHVYISSGLNSFLLYGKIFRRDEVDSYHFPVFHQFEGVKLFEEDLIQSTPNSVPMQQNEYFKEAASFVISDLRTTLDKTLKDIFGRHANIRWPETHYPYTFPSFEAEVEYDGNWLEILGAGVLQKKILDACLQDSHNKIGWAFGLGLERLAMILFNIPDIRWFWSNDDRFLNQFQAGKITHFKPFSSCPPLIRDLSFYMSSKQPFADNDVFDLIRQGGGDLVESVKLVNFTLIFLD